MPAPLIGFLVALVFLILRIPVPDFATSTLTYIGNIVTPLSLIYIGIVLAKAGLKSIHFDQDTIVTLVGRFILAPIVMFGLLYLTGKGLPVTEFKTLWFNQQLRHLRSCQFLPAKVMVMSNFQLMSLP